MSEPILLEAVDAHAVSDARLLFREYEAWLGLDLCFQGFEAELVGLPGKYAGPSGGLYVAYCGDEAIGCVAFRPFDAGRCEMKRLFVRPGHQGLGLGRRLTELVIREAENAGYSGLLLDTLPGKMDSAIALYRSLGFAEIEPYYDNPYEGVLFMERSLRGASADHIP